MPALREQLLSSKRVQSVPFDPAQFQEANEPPPMGVFLLLDREIPQHSASLSRDNVPKVQGEMLLYGKETDRPARSSDFSKQWRNPDPTSRTISGWAASRSTVTFVSRPRG